MKQGWFMAKKMLDLRMMEKVFTFYFSVGTVQAHDRATLPGTSPPDIICYIHARSIVLSLDSLTDSVLVFMILFGWCLSKLLRQVR